MVFRVVLFRSFYLAFYAMINAFRSTASEEIYSTGLRIEFVFVLLERTAMVGLEKKERDRNG